MMTIKTVGTYDAVETSIDLARTEKTGTWESINKKKRRRIIQWDDIPNVVKKQLFETNAIVGLQGEANCEK